MKDRGEILAKLEALASSEYNVKDTYTTTLEIASTVLFPRSISQPCSILFLLYLQNRGTPRGKSTES